MLKSMLSLLRPYQQQIVLPVLESVYDKHGLTFTVEIARQGGKNEISASLETLILTRFSHLNRNLIKCSPTFKPQTLISIQRLKDKLNASGLAGSWISEMGYIIRLNSARIIFLSADASSNVVGNTAHLLLEVDEAQDVNEDKFSKEFKPMGSTTNVTCVLFGTTWNESTLLEKMKQMNLELERKDGIKRHFRFDWQEVARYNPDYLNYVESERARLGENHPLFLTQYRLLPLHGGGGFLNTLQRVQLQGEHSRLAHPEPGKIYVAGIDLAGEAEAAEDEYLKSLVPRQDSTVITIGELDFSGRSIGPEGEPFIPSVKVVEHYVWTGERHSALYSRILDILKNVWHCRQIVVDSTGIGQPVASFLKAALGSRIVPFVFSAPSKSELGFDLLAAVNSGKLKMYRSDNSPQYREFWSEMDKAKSPYRANRTLNFFVDPADGNDDYLMSLALLVRASQDCAPRSAHGNLSPTY
jgi:hypothetical protein